MKGSIYCNQYSSLPWVCILINIFNFILLSKSDIKKTMHANCKTKQTNYSDSWILAWQWALNKVVKRHISKQSTQKDFIKVCKGFILITTNLLNKKNTLKRCHVSVKTKLQILITLPLQCTYCVSVTSILMVPVTGVEYM